MPKILHEADNFTVDLRSIYNNTSTTTDEPEDSTEDTQFSEADAELADVLRQNGIEDLSIITKIVALGDTFKKQLKL